jgi:signal transduction histidine kinase
MNAVLGYTQILEHDPAFPERHHRALKAIGRAGSHLLGVINQIPDLSKIEAGAMQLDVDDFDLEELIESISAIFRVRCEQKGLDWTVQRRIERATVRGDQGKLRQVLINLLGNAVKFTERGGVQLVVSQNGNNYRFEVTDTDRELRRPSGSASSSPFNRPRKAPAKAGRDWVSLSRDAKSSSWEASWR